MKNHLTRRHFGLGVVAGFVAMNSKFASAADEPAVDLANPKHHKLAAEYSASCKGISMLVRVDDKELFSDYPNSGKKDRAHELASGTKSFCGVLVAAAIQDKLISSWDEKVSDTLSEWKEDTKKKTVTLRQLLSLTSGMAGGGIGRVPTYADAMASEFKFDPGQRFQYGPAPFQTFGEVLRRKLEPKKESPYDYLQRRILKPIGLQVGSWRKGADGQIHLPSGAALTATEWAKFGEFVRAGGVHEGKELLSSAALDECFVPGKINPSYGLSFWLASGAGNTREALAPGLARFRGGGEKKDDLRVPDLVFAAGAGNQRLFISRKLKLIAIRQADGILAALGGNDSTGWNDREFLSRLMYGTDAAGKKL
ncbi:serine hydrolase domain-containing protein [Anatilimnocola floriformis]|uniref:serine hydrolase domain-containing protein n=1 Tax=Anatilimnocola floriformis TaxID=2948575 RepID=UPI0020C3BB70|nr:serine hydrolase [Anatilimnocola floriformis]